MFDFIMDVCSAIGDSGVSGTADAAPGSSVPDIDIDAEVEAYRQQLELQKKAAAESSLSSGGNDGKGQVKRRHSRGILQQNFLAASRSRTCGSNREAAE